MIMNFKNCTGRPNPGAVATLFILAIWFTFFVEQSMAAESDLEYEMKVCLDMKNDIERLSCFDSLAHGLSETSDQQSQKDRGCRDVSLEDLKLDIQELMGECISTQGVVTLLGEMAFIGEGGLDTSPVGLDVQGLPRNERKILLRCSPNCRLRVTGIVENVLMGPGLVARSIEK